MCLGYGSVLVTQIPDMCNQNRAGFYLADSFRGCSLSWWVRHGSRYVWTTGHICTHSSEAEWGWTVNLKVLTRYLLQLPQPFKTVLPTGNQVVKHMNLWGHFIFKPPNRHMNQHIKWECVCQCVWGECTDRSEVYTKDLLRALCWWEWGGEVQRMSASWLFLQTCTDMYKTEVCCADMTC